MKYHVKGRISGVHIIHEDFDLAVDEIIEAYSEKLALFFAEDNAIDDSGKPFGTEETEVYFRRLEIVPLEDTELTDAEIAHRDGEEIMRRLGIPMLFDIPDLPATGAALPSAGGC